MHSDHKDEGRWDGLREVGRMAGPVMLGAISFAVMDFVDRMFVSSLGMDHFAAVGSSGVWAYTLGMFFLGITGCVSTFVAQSHGRGNFENCSRYAWQGIYISMAAGSVALVMWPLADELFGTMGHSEAVTELEVAYFRIRTLGYAFVAWQAALAGFFQAINRPVVPMVVAFVANMMNIGLDYVLIFGKFGFPAWGIEGAAIATVASLAVQVFLLQSIFLTKGVDAEYGSRRTQALDLTKLKDLFRIGWPSGVTGFLDVFGWAVFTSFIVGGFGTLQLAAHNGALTFMHFAFIPALGLSQAATPIVGQWIGRGNIAIAKARAYTATKVGITIMVTTGVTMAVFGESLMRIFSDDPDIIKLGHQLLIMAAIFAGFDAINIVLIGALRGAGDTRWIMMALIIGTYVFMIPMAWLFARPLGLEAMGAWIGATLYVIGLSGVVLWRFHSEAWRHIRIFSEDGEPEALVQPEAALEPGDLSSS